MQKSCLSWLAFTVLFCVQAAAEPSLLTPLAYSSAPVCSKKPGTRTARSHLVQFGDVTASLTSQATREGNSCFQSAALWVTHKGVSEQFELRDAAANTFAIQDIAPDSSAILLSSIATTSKFENGQSSQIGLVSLTDAALKWTPISELLSSHSCDASFDPQGFADSKHIVIAAIPRPSRQPNAACANQPVFYSIDVNTHLVRTLNPDSLRRVASSVSGPLQSCKTDPDLVGACYTARARLALAGDGLSMLLWPLGANYTMQVEEGMVPSSLRSKISPDTRVYATMVICPLSADQFERRRHICVDSATNFHSETHADKRGHSAGTLSVSVANGDSN